MKKRLMVKYKVMLKNLTALLKSTISLLAVILLVILLPATTATAFANTSKINTIPFDSAILESSARNITARQLPLKESINLLAEAGENSQDDAFLQNFNQAWTKRPLRKENLFGVCNTENTEINTSICLNSLKTFLKEKKDLLIGECYQPGKNGKLCLDLVLEELGVKLKDIDGWIGEL